MSQTRWVLVQEAVALVAYVPVPRCGARERR